jgi:very-short-patch-repair endonuclease
MNKCLECNQSLTEGVIEFSTNNFGISLSMQHQDWKRQMQSQTTFEAIRLYFALKKRGVRAEMEKFDGYKHIDIAIPEAKVNIEVDGRQHHDKGQALADLKRTYHSFIKGYLTLRIPNNLVYDDNILEETAQYIVDLLNENVKKQNFRINNTR